MNLIIYTLSGFRAHQKPSAIPATMCQMPHHAAINAIPPSPLNNRGLKINTKPNPEFWIPVSMVMVRRFWSESLSNVEKPYPVRKAKEL